MSFLLNLTSLNGPAPTSGELENVFRSLPLCPVYLLQTCWGRIASCWNWPSTLPGAFVYLTTSVVAFGALAFLMCATRPAALAAPPAAYLMSVLIVQAASFAVSGWPSVHFAPERVVNVQVLPPSLAFHEVAKSGTNLLFDLSYWIRNG